MKEKYIGGAALTGVSLASLAWKHRGEWWQTNKGVVDPDFDCSELSQYGLPCTKNTEGLDPLDVALIVSMFIGMAVMYGYRRENRA
jgi:hypothetical protein